MISKEEFVGEDAGQLKIHQDGNQPRFVPRKEREEYNKKRLE